MAQDHEPMTDDEFETAKEALQALRSDVREALADELGGEADDYRADVPVADGGE
ncbi:MAG: hypothetical protein ACOC0Z_05535 [Halohasta sp.]